MHELQSFTLYVMRKEQSGGIVVLAFQRFFFSTDQVLTL